MFSTQDQNSSRSDAYVAAYATACPQKVPIDHFHAVVEQHRRKRGQPEKVIEAFQKVSASTGIRNINYSAYQFHEGTDRATVVTQGKNAGDPGPGERDVSQESYTEAERQVVWEHLALTISVEAAEKALAKWTGDASEITHVVTTCTSGWVEPGIASNLITSLNLPLNACKMELNYNGCFTGMTCLRAARDIVKASDEGERRVVLVVCTELASVQYHPEATDPQDLVAMSLFADGSGAFVVAPEGQWRIRQAGCNLVPDTKHLLGMRPQVYGQPYRSCYTMTLHRDVPSALGEYFDSGNGAELLEKILGDRAIQEQLPALAVHPGGPAILNSLNKVLIANHKFPMDCLDMSYETLNENGNLGSTAILFVLENVFNTTDAEEVMSLAFGPGVTVEWGMFQRRPTEGVEQVAGGN